MNGMSVTPISWQDFHSWSFMRKHTLTYTQLELIKAIDAAYVSRSNANASTTEQPTG